MNIKNKHGMSKTRFYNIWVGIKSRCLDKKCKDYKNYGGKGILLDSQWIDFKIFMEDMLSEYIKHSIKFTEKDTTIDRINNLKGYSKKNCRWSTMKIQENNKDKSYLKNKLKDKNGRYKKAQELRDEANKL